MGSCGQPLGRRRSIIWIRGQSAAFGLACSTAASTNTPCSAEVSTPPPAPLGPAQPPPAHVEHARVLHEWRQLPRPPVVVHQVLSSQCGAEPGPAFVPVKRGEVCAVWAELHRGGGWDRPVRPFPSARYWRHLGQGVLGFGV